MQTDAFNEPNLRDQLSEANLSFPIIVKPQIACGVGDAHNMVIWFLFQEQYSDQFHVVDSRKV